MSSISCDNTATISLSPPEAISPAATATYTPPAADTKGAKHAKRRYCKDISIWIILVSVVIALVSIFFLQEQQLWISSFSSPFASSFYKKANDESPVVRGGTFIHHSPHFYPTRQSDIPAKNIIKGSINLEDIPSNHGESESSEDTSTSTDDTKAYNGVIGRFRRHVLEGYLQPLSMAVYLNPNITSSSPFAGYSYRPREHFFIYKQVRAE
jgi:hypothetical protein